MALYRTGTASLSSDGVITGQGTKWRDPLTLIRTGATIIFLDDGIKLAVISDIISDTEMRAITTDGETATDSKYVVLLNDSLTVDGMAQDVAETLRYYQGKETAVQEAIDAIEALDISALTQLAADVRADAEAAKLSEDNAAASAAEASNLKDDTQQIKVDTQAIKDGAVADINTAKDAGISDISSAKDAALTDMNQVKTDVTALKDAAAASAAAAEQSAVDSEESKVASSAFATESKNEADRAQSIADGMNPAQYMKVENNLDDVADKATARENLEVFSKDEIADLLPGYLGQVEWQEMRSALQPGTIPRDGQEVDQTGIFADLYAKAVAGKLPTCTEAEWQADPLNRGCYVLESSPGKMRLPDDNGVQPGSLKIPVKVGDGGLVANDGQMGKSALPTFKSTFGAKSALSDTTGSDTGGFTRAAANRTTAPNLSNASGASGDGTVVTFDPGLVSDVYQEGVTEIRPNRQQGCWTVRYAVKATNGGSIDALALATQIAAGDAELLAKIIATNARVDYAMLDFGTMALSERKVMDNPFGINQPVEVVAEIQRTDLSSLPQPRWGETGWIYANGGGYGVKASYMEGEGIVVQCGNLSMGNNSTQTGSPHQITSTANVNNLPVRVHVRKITA